MSHMRTEKCQLKLTGKSLGSYSISLVPTKAKILTLVTDEWLCLGFPVKKIHCRALEAKFKWEQEWVGERSKSSRARTGNILLG